MKHHQRAFWRTHFAILTLAAFFIGLGIILLSQQTSLIVLGITGLLIAHVVAFGSLFLFGGGWIASKFRAHSAQPVEVEDV